MPATTIPTALTTTPFTAADAAAALAPPAVAAAAVSPPTLDTAAATPAVATATLAAALAAPAVATTAVATSVATAERMHPGLPRWNELPGAVRHPHMRGDPGDGVRLHRLLRPSCAAALVAPLAASATGASGVAVAVRVQHPVHGGHMWRAQRIVHMRAAHGHWVHV